MAITPILNSNVERSIEAELNDKYIAIKTVAEKIEEVDTLAEILGNAGIDFTLLATAIDKLSTLTSDQLNDLAQSELTQISEDLAKGNYLGKRKLDIDLSLQMENGIPVEIQQANVITIDGINVQIPFDDGSGNLTAISSPSLILERIRDGIDAYNANEPDANKHVRYTEYDLLNETDVTKPTVIQVRDTDGHSSSIDRIELIKYSTSTVLTYTWIDTTSALQVLADQVQHLLIIGNSIAAINDVSSKIDELLVLEGATPQLVTNSDSLYNELNKLQALYDRLTMLNGVYDDIKVGGTNYTNVVATDLTDLHSKIKELANDLQSGSSKLNSLYTNMTKLTTVYDNIVNSVLTNINAKIVDGSIASISNNISGLQTIYNNITEILASKSYAEDAQGQAQIATAQAQIATEKADSIHSLQTTATTLVEGANAFATYDSSTNKITFGIPQGPKGDRGEAFKVDVVGLLSDRSIYDDRLKGFSFLAIDQGELFFKASDDVGDWSDAIPFGKGDKGDPGVGINSITFTSTTDPSGLPGKLNAIDTYTITLDDGSTSTFTVTNGVGKTIVSGTVHNINAEANYVILCDTTPIKRKDLLKDFTVQPSTMYAIKIDNVDIEYVSDPYVNRTDKLINIQVDNDQDYSVNIAIGGTTSSATYHSDAAVAQVDVIDSITVEDDADYTVTLNTVPLTYHSDPAVKKIVDITGIVVQDDADYTIDIDGTQITYHSDAAVAQVDEISGITASNSTVYAVTIDGTEVSYTSDADATVEEIATGLKDAINADATVSGIVTATLNATNDGVLLTANTAGDAFTTEVTNGAMTVATITENDNATESEILTGFKSAIDNANVAVTTTLISGGIRLEANVAGVPFTATAVTNNFSLSLVQDNNKAELLEILQGLADEVNNSTEPVSAAIVNDTVELTADVAGDAFTLEAVTSNLAVHNKIVNDRAELSEIIDGLVAAINSSGVVGVTASGYTTYVAIVADDHNGDFTTTVTAGTMTVESSAADEPTLDEVITGLTAAISNSGAAVTPLADTVNGTITIEANVAGMNYALAQVAGPFSIQLLVPNQEGIDTVTLPANPEIGDIITVVDAAQSFGNKPLTVVANGNAINNQAGDLVLNKAGTYLSFLFAKNGWNYDPNSSASGILALLSTVDGSGSGLDADLLDGKEGAAYEQFSIDSAIAMSIALG